MVNLGCAKNLVDAEIMASAMIDEGWKWSHKADDAEVIIVNTCGFIESAKVESLDVLFGMRKEYPEKKIIAAGCLSERYKEELRASLSEADAFLGTGAPHRIVDLVNDNSDRPILIPEKMERREWKRSRLLGQFGNFSTYIKISEGCDNCCAFCAIPLIKGGVNSREPQAVVDEIRDLIDRGVFEFNITAQDTASYGKDNNSSLPLLLEEILSIDKPFWLRLLYLHPDNFPAGNLPLIASDRRILPYFDIPFQHASKPILKQMNRAGDKEHYLELLALIREKLPDAVLRSTFLTGFPGETEDDFEQLLDFQQKAELDWLGVFAYSQEEGTAAATLYNQIPQKIAKKRKDNLLESQREITERKMQRFMGKELEILVEEEIKEEELAIGRGFLHAPEVDGAAVIHGKELKAGERYLCSVKRVNNFDLEVYPV